MQLDTSGPNLFNRRPFKKPRRRNTDRASAARNHLGDSWLRSEIYVADPVKDCIDSRATIERFWA